MAENQGITATAEEIARMFRRDASTVRRWAREGCPHTKRGRELHFNTAATLEWYLDRQARGAAEVEARTRLLRARSEKAELEAAKLRAELVPTDTVAAIWAAMVKELRRRSLAAVPKLARASSAAAATYPAQQTVLKDGVHGLLTALAEIYPAEAAAG